MKDKTKTEYNDYNHKATILDNIGGVVKHFKGDYYLLISISNHHETGSRFMVYKALYGSCITYIRPLDEFCSKVDSVKYPESLQTYRFEKVSELPSLVKSKQNHTDGRITNVNLDSVIKTGYLIGPEFEGNPPKEGLKIVTGYISKTFSSVYKNVYRPFPELIYDKFAGGLMGMMIIDSDGTEVGKITEIDYKKDTWYGEIDTDKCFKPTGPMFISFNKGGDNNE